MIFIFSTSFSSLVWSSENYDDCIFKNMKGIGSDLGAREIIDLCKAKHINTKPSICFEIDAQTTNGIIFLKGMNEPYSGNNLCNYTNGQVKSKGNIKNGKLIGKVTNWHDNGQISSEEHYLDGKQDGKWTQWYANGMKWTDRNYKDGKQDGKWTTWYTNGLKWTERNYKDGTQDGKSTEWFANGQIKTEENYKDGMKDI